MPGWHIIIASVSRTVETSNGFRARPEDRLDSSDSPVSIAEGQLVEALDDGSAADDKSARAAGAAIVLQLRARTKSPTRVL